MCSFGQRLLSWDFGIGRHCCAATALQASSSCIFAFWGCRALSPLQAGRLLSCLLPSGRQAALAPQLHTPVIMSGVFV